MKLLIVALALVSTYSVAGTVKCGNPTWVSEPKIAEQLFTGEMTAECIITADAGADIRNAERYLENIFKDQIITTHEAAARDNSLGLPGKRWDLSIKHKSGVLRYVIRIATDERDTVVYKSESKEVKFTGFASFVRKINNGLTLKRVSREQFKLTFHSFSQAAKPALSTNAIFLSLASKSMVDVFNEEAQKTAKGIAEGL